MFRLTREVRFSINRDDAPIQSRAVNGFAGHPPTRGFGLFLALQVTLRGQLNPDSNYLRNIREIDEVVRSRGIARLRDSILAGRSAEVAILDLYENLKNAWNGSPLDGLKLNLTPFLAVAVEAREEVMIRLSQMFEFSASHRLHNPELSDEQNRATFGKCNNPHGHGHNYILQVTVGEPASAGGTFNLEALEKVVDDTIIKKFDHKNLNVELPEFKDLIPSVENIARTIYRTLKPQLPHLSSVTVWETPKTWCEYSE